MRAAAPLTIHHGCRPHLRRGVVRRGPDGSTDPRVCTRAAGASRSTRCHSVTPAPCATPPAAPPVPRYTNICPNLLSTDASQLTAWVNTIRHEIIHALGFSAWHYAYFRDADGNPLTPRDAYGHPPKSFKCSWFFPEPSSSIIISSAERGCVHSLLPPPRAPASRSLAWWRDVTCPPPRPGRPPPTRCQVHGVEAGDADAGGRGARPLWLCCDGRRGG